MKQVRAACLLQTICFSPGKGTDQTKAAQSVREEIIQYKARLERNHIACVIDEEIPQPDGSMILRIRKQYNSVPVGDYLA